MFWSFYSSLFPHFSNMELLSGVLPITYDTHIKPIHLLRKKVTRSISFEHFTSPSTAIFSDLKIFKFHDLFELKLLTFMYESVNKISPFFFHNIFETLTSVHHYDIRQPSKR